MSLQLPKAKTGIQGLDELTGGGFSHGHSTLLCGGAGCGKTLMVMEFLVLVLSRVRVQLEAEQARGWMKDQNAALEAEVIYRMGQNDLTQQVTIRALAHLVRTQDYVQRLARRLQTHLRFAHLLTKHYIELLARSAPLHDIGKVGIPDHILLNPQLRA